VVVPLLVPLRLPLRLLRLLRLPSPLSRCAYA
jgi:hypothetical protein